MFQQIDQRFGEYFQCMRSENLFDLENRVGKSPGAYCTGFAVSKRPFIFMNAVGLPDDIRTLLHESGHAFHNFARFHLPYAQQRVPGLEFAEVASMSTELLAYPYLSQDWGGLYSTAEAKRFQSHHLKRILAFWPYMAVVDAFQHWVYTHQIAASDSANCDRKWLELWERFIPGVDWSGLEDSVATGWHRKPHIFRHPFYYIEYGLAQLGAFQVWRNALQDRQLALRHLKNALDLGGTASLPDLYQAAGAKLAFDEGTLADVVEFIEDYIALLDTGKS
jgi:oligoendopeptidase F